MYLLQISLPSPLYLHNMLSSQIHLSLPTESKLFDLHVHGCGTVYDSSGSQLVSHNPFGVERPFHRDCLNNIGKHRYLYYSS